MSVKIAVAVATVLDIFCWRRRCSRCRCDCCRRRRGRCRCCWRRCWYCCHCWCYCLVVSGVGAVVGRCYCYWRQCHSCVAALAAVALVVLLFLLLLLLLLLRMMAVGDVVAAADAVLSSLLAAVVLFGVVVAPLLGCWQLVVGCLALGSIDRQELPTNARREEVESHAAAAWLHVAAHDKGLPPSNTGLPRNKLPALWRGCAPPPARNAP